MFGFKKKRRADLGKIANELTDVAADSGLPAYFINIGDGSEPSDKIICHIGAPLPTPLRKAIAGMSYIDERENEEEVNDFVSGKTKIITLVTMKELSEFAPTTDSEKKGDEFVRNAKELIQHIGSVMDDGF